ncbi:diguanylate cyclase [Vibrio sinensis]|uniref:Diguanylate cyclase n=2 Tax=Vibrio sinensis TaxID=2302434 RepID=A0A3A6QRN7_9VIBR|nr:diguanylate cyclase [Vibrio sinensis]
MLYQPKIKNDIIVSLEALLRPQTVTVPISEYLSQVENVTCLDSLVINECIKDIDLVGLNIPVSINIHPSSMFDNEFISNTIKKCQGKKIVLELVEYQHVDIDDTFLSNVNRLKQHGLKISVDDFGKDFARADLALSIGANEVKFDRSLVKDIENNYIKFKHLSFLCSKIKSLCTNNIVFEGVENKRQKELIELMVKDPILQGFYFFHPMKLADVTKLDQYSIESDSDEVDDSLPLGLDLDYQLYKFLVGNDISTINDSSVNNFIRGADKLGLVYNNDVNITLCNLRKIYFDDSSVVGNGVMSLFNSTEKLVVLRNEYGVVVYDNTAHQKVVGRTLVGIDPKELIEINDTYFNCIKQDQYLLQDDQRLFHKSKEIFDDVEFTTIREKIIYNGNPFVMTTISEVNASSLDVSRDELTKCYNRSYLNTKFGCCENKVIAFLDMNGFKAINDQYGHKFGDNCLVDFINLLNSSLRSSDVVIRYGGDEFVIIFDSTSVIDVNNRLNSINALTKRYFLEKNCLLSFSYGLSTVVEHNIESAIERADEEMYIQKRKRNSNLIDFI